MKKFTAKYSFEETVDGLMADHHGSDSGIRDPILKNQLREYLDGLEDHELHELLGTYARDKLLSDYAIKAGYGLESVCELMGFINSLCGDIYYIR
jgi:hypothetical protein